MNNANGHLSLSKNSKSSIESHLSSELNETLLALCNCETELQPEQTYTSRDICRESWRDRYSEINWSSTMNTSASSETQDNCETKLSNEPTSHQISHVISPDMVFPNDLHISDEFSYKIEKNMSNESSRDWRSDAILINVDFSNDLLFSNDILHKFKENISEVSNPDDVISSVICPHNVFVSRGKFGHCEAQVLREFKRNYSSDNLISNVGYPIMKSLVMDPLVNMRNMF